MAPAETSKAWPDRQTQADGVPIMTYRLSADSVGCNTVRCAQDLIAPPVSAAGVRIVLRRPDG